MAAPAMGGAGGAPGAPAAPAYKIVGAGTFGAVVKPALPNEVGGVPTEYPNNVTKLFYKKKSLNDAMNAIDRLPALMNARSGPNAGHNAHFYTKKYKGRNLPPSLLHNLQAKNPKFSANENLYLMRMKDLGVDVASLEHPVKGVASVDTLRKLPIRILLEQILKLYKQTASLAENGFGHFDISRGNVMVHPTTGTMTIVDFDWMNSYDNLIAKGYPFGFYINPPECLMRGRWNRIFQKNPYGNYEYDEHSMDTFVQRKPLAMYEANQGYAFKYMYTELGMIDHSGRVSIEHAIHVANMNNIIKFRAMHDMEGMTKDEIFYKVLATYDNFSLGLVLLEFLVTLYPTLIAAVDEKALIANLKLVITNGEKPYTDQEFLIIVKTLRQLTELLLSSLTSFAFEDRMNPIEVPDAIQHILDTFDAAWAVAEAGGAAAAPARVVGGRRRTRRRHHKKIKTRSKRL